MWAAAAGLGFVLPVARHHVRQPPLLSTGNAYLVVEGFINNGPDSTVITLSHTYPLSDTAQATPEPGATVSVSGSARTVTAGNPNLNPFLAKAYDFSGEWYYDKGALFGVAVFQKDISSFVQTVTTGAGVSGAKFGWDTTCGANTSSIDPVPPTISERTHWLLPLEQT